MAPERIVSLVPSLTETLFALGVGERVVGRTRYCTQPPRTVGKIAKVGGTKKIDVERVLELDPDLVVAVKEANSRENMAALTEHRPTGSRRAGAGRGGRSALRDLAEGSRAPTEHVLEPSSAPKRAEGQGQRAASSLCLLGYAEKLPAENGTPAGQDHAG